MRRLLPRLIAPPQVAKRSLTALIVLLSAVTAHGIEIDWIMYQDPMLPNPPIEVRIPPEVVPLWIQALKRPERDLSRRVATAIVAAQAKGLPGLEATIEPLMKLFEQSGEDRVTRLTAARALVALDARQAAPLLVENLQPNDLDMAEVVEPALARWAYAPMREVWLQRLGGKVTLRRVHVLAIRGLTALEERSALPRLLELAQDDATPFHIRLEAAIALGQMQSTGLEDVARALIAEKRPQAVSNRLVAAKMLAAHRGNSVQSMLTELATHPQPSVQAIALSHLYRIDPNLIMPLAEQTITSADANVRHWSARALVAAASPERLTLLARLLDDPHPDVRRYVCDSLAELAQNEALRDAIVAEGRRVLLDGGWRGREQAILLLVTLDDKSIVDRLLTLLDDSRAEVHTTAAWGLCRLDVAATAEPILQVFADTTDRWISGAWQKAGTSAQLSHLAQAMGKMRYAPADPVLRKYISKAMPFPPTPRAAAIWALGHLHADQPDSKLASQLVERLTDIRAMAPERPEVRRLAAVSLGRMKAEESLPALRSMMDFESVQSGVGYACGWALNRMTGEAIPDVSPNIVVEDNWFLMPIQNTP